MNEDGYEKAKSWERDRERHSRRTRQGAFESQMLSLDAQASNGNEPRDHEPAWVNDGGVGADAIRDFDNGKRIEERANRKANYDRTREYINYYRQDLLAVFGLIVKNGKDRDKSIWELVDIMEAERIEKKKQKREARQKARHKKPPRKRRGARRRSDTTGSADNSKCS